MTSQQPEERYYEECVRLPADEDAKRVLLQRTIDERTRRGWQLISAVKQPADAVLVVAWDTSGTYF